jgi:hypothetical protein
VEAAGRKQTSYVIGGGSYLSASDPRLLFGLGQDTKIEKVAVYWSWGGSQTWKGNQFKADHYWQLTEGQKKVEPWTGKGRN